MIDVPKFTRLEYLTSNGWVVGHAGTNLLHPERYVVRLADHGKYGRATVLADDLVTELEQYVTPGADDVDLSLLVRPSTGNPDIPQLAATCPICDERHAEPFDGSCLL